MRRGRAFAVLGQRGEFVALDHAERYPRVQPPLWLVTRALHVKFCEDVSVSVGRSKPAHVTLPPGHHEARIIV
jgi:hypothetical protein